MKRLLLIGAALLAAMCSSDDDAERITGPTELKLMSFNIRGITADDTGDRSWDARREPVVEMLRKELPDVVCLQEPKWQQVAYLIQQLTEYGHVKKNTNEGSATEATGAFNTILFRKDRFALLDEGGYWLSSNPDRSSYPWNATDEQRRVTVWVRLKDKATSRQFCVFTTHLPYKTEPEDDAARLECVRLNVERMRQAAGESMPLFIAGDMNASNAEADRRRICLEPYYKWMASARDQRPESDPHYSYNAYGDSVPGQTWNIDHIFYRNAEALAFRTVVEGYGVPYLSDHYPITCTFKF